MSIPHIEVSVITIQAQITIAELTAIEGPVVIIKTGERGPSAAVLEEAIVKCGFRQCVPIFLDRHQTGRGKVPET